MERAIMTRRNTRLTLLASWSVALLAFPLVHCDESLPPRDDPQSFLAVRVSTSGEPVTVYLPNTIYGGTIHVEVENLCDEVLEADSSIWVTVEVWPKGFPDKIASITANSTDLLNPGIVHGEVVTLRPDSAAVFVKPWSQRADDGTPMWNFGHLTRRLTGHGTPFCESDSIRLVGRATVKLFKHVAPVESPEADLKVIYRLFGVDC